MKTQQTAIFSTSDALRFGFRATLDNLKPLLLLGVAGAFLALLHQALATPPGQASLRSLLALAVQVLQMGVSFLFVRTALRLHDRLNDADPLQLSEPASLLREFFPFLLGAVVYGLVVALGCLLLLIPGIYWAVKYGFWGFALLDKQLNPLDALGASAELTAGEKWHLLGFGLALLGVNLLGALALGIGMLVTLPTSALAAAYVYRRLEAHAASAGHTAAQRSATLGSPATSG
jgi:uncharacterized membrane protein